MGLHLKIVTSTTSTIKWNKNFMNNHKAERRRYLSRTSYLKLILNSLIQDWRYVHHTLHYRLECEADLTCLCLISVVSCVRNMWGDLKNCKTSCLIYDHGSLAHDYTKCEDFIYKGRRDLGSLILWYLTVSCRGDCEEIWNLYGDWGNFFYCFNTSPPPAPQI